MADLIKSSFTDNEKTEIRDLIISTLVNYDDIIRVKSGNIQSGNFIAGSTGWNLDSSGNIEANSGTFRGEMTVTDPNISLTISGGTTADIIFTDATAGNNPVGMIYLFNNSGSRYVQILGHEGIILQRAFFTGVAWQWVNVATFDSNGVSLSGPSGNFVSRDGSAGITANQVFKDGAGVNHTMTIKNGIITGIA